MKILGYEVRPTHGDYEYVVYEYVSHVRIDLVRRIKLFNKIPFLTLHARTRRICRGQISAESVMQASHELHDYSPYNAVYDEWVPRRQ